MTSDEEIDFICERFEAADCEVALETCTIGLNIDIADRQPYTLLPVALNTERVQERYGLPSRGDENIH